ncbi:MAG TPA: CPBP family intramembrane glutamic endopeptidase [Mariniphaga sp.]|nr:CPBP family intramembrane glutamic endopeptidase [Mariniphaga sp.]
MEFYNLGNDSSIGVIILGVVVFYYIYYYTSESKSIVKFIQQNVADGNSGLALFFYKKINGLFLLGVVPAFLYFSVLNASGDKFGLSLNHLSSSFLLVAGLILLTAIVLFFHHRGKPNRSTLQIYPAQWNTSLFMLNILGWSLYLIAYEFLFRGILLFECYEHLGFWPAVAINISIYSAIHMVNGKDQTIGALVFGTLACYFTLTRGTLLIPIFMHLSLSILSNFYSVKNMQHFQMDVKKPVNIKDK